MTEKKNSIFIPSPFPWSPGHTVTELEYLIQHQVLDTCKAHIYVPILPGPVTTPFLKVYSEHLQKFNITAIQDHAQICGILRDTARDDFYSCSLSHAVHLPDGYYSDRQYRPSSVHSLYSQLSGGRLRLYDSSTASVLTQLNTFSINYYSLPEQRALIPRTSIGCIDQQIPEVVSGSRRLALINIREHQANGSAGMNISDFVPLLSYLKESGYVIMDVSHESKSCLQELKEYDVIPYWALPDKSFYHDLDLFSHADFYVGGGGISHLALAMKIPSIWVGSLFPLVLPIGQGYQLCCRLAERHTGRHLSIDESMRVLFALRNTWDQGYDCWSRKWGYGGNPFNCYQTLQTKYYILKPAPIDLLLAFMQLELDVAMGHFSKPQIYHDSIDLLGRAVLAGKVWPSSHN